MLKSVLLKSRGKPRKVRHLFGVIGLLVAVLTLAASAAGQNFAIQMAPFPSPAAVDPGGTSSADITVSPLNGFNGTVDLSCQVTPQQPPPATTPVCVVSPASVAPLAHATATVTTQGSTPAGQYAFTITGTISGTSTSLSAAPQYLTVLAVTPDFTITVAEAVQPNSVHAGSYGRGTVSINPLYGYSGSVVLSCASVTPLVTLPPECSFNPNPVPVTAAGAATSKISISTIGPTQSALAHPRPFYAFCLPLPLLALAGVLSGKRSRRAWCLLVVLVVAGTMLLMPACGSGTTTVTPSNPDGKITPNNTYTFTLMGVDANGVSSSNTGTSAPTVSLTVD
jgi:hypothetical protein